MSKAKLLAAVAAVALISVALVALLWWHSSVEDKLGYCKTPTDTCVNRENAAIGEPCECLGVGGGVFGLDSTGVVVPKNSN
jgi:hypothetical protein